MSKLLMTLLAGLTTFNIMLAQSPADLYKIIPPAPDASSLGKFAEIPVSHYTGVPNIETPIWQLSNGPLNVNIGLSYHASGVKVEEIASCVGLNWALNAGGVITRSVVGLPDDIATPDKEGFLNYSQRIDFDINDLPYQTPTDRYTIFRQHTDGCLDTESDIYYFNFVGITGKFTFDWNQNLIIASDKKIQIIPTYNVNDPVTKITQWTIKTGDGTTFVFAARENTTYQNVSDHSNLSCNTRPMTYTSSWYLTQMTSSNETHSIDFTYSDYSIDHGFSSSETFTHKYTLIPSYNCPGDINPFISRTSATLLTHGKKIDEITSSNGFHVKFNSDKIAQRTDVQGTNLYSIDEIKVRYGNEEINNYRLTYNYLGGGRLRLTNLQEKGSNNSSEKPGYQFLYNTTELPPRTSKKQDYWGYYNSNDATHMVPPLAILHQMNGGYTFFPGANRDPDPTKMKAGLLEKIVYPTGGTTTFEYEPHDYSYIQSDEVSSLNIPVLEDAITFVGKAGDFSNTWSSEPLELTRNTVIGISASFSDPPLLGDLQDWMYPKVRITDVNGLTKYQRVYQEGPGSAFIYLPAGSYTVSAFAYANDGNGREDVATINVFWKRPSSETKKKLLAGGLRIKNIVYHDGLGGNPDITEHYSYKMRSDANKSSGVLVGEIRRSNDEGNYYDLADRLPAFVHEYVTIASTAICGTCNCTYVHRFSVNKSGLGTANGSHIGYREVTQNRTGELSGKTIYVFDSPFEFPDEVQNYLPFPPSLSNDHKRGLLKQRISLKHTGNGAYTPVHEELYKYSYHSTSVSMLRAALFKQSHESDENYHYKIYPLQMGYSFPSNKEVRIYNDQSSDFLSSSEQYLYNTTDKQMKSVTLLNSTGKELVTSYAHPNDFTSLNDGIINELIARHMYNPILKQETTVNSALNEGTITEYTITGNLLLPSRSLQFEIPRAGISESSESILSNRNYKVQTLFNSYDSKGNILDLSSRNNTHTSFLWGYNSTYPIARITNTAPANIFYTSFEEETTGIISEGLTGSKSSVNGLNRQITPITNGPYTLSYWKKENGSWRFITEPKAITGNSFSISLAGQIDEVRFYPQAAQASTYTYSPGFGISSASDANGEILFYEYDGFARLSTIKNTKKEVVKTFQYFYNH